MVLYTYAMKIPDKRSTMKYFLERMTTKNLFPPLECDKHDYWNTSREPSPGCFLQFIVRVRSTRN